MALALLRIAANEFTLANALRRTAGRGGNLAPIALANAVAARFTADVLVLINLSTLSRLILNREGTV
jgi:hypothetical protein